MGLTVSSAIRSKIFVHFCVTVELTAIADGTAVFLSKDGTYVHVHPALQPCRHGFMWFRIGSHGGIS